MPRYGRSGAGEIAMLELYHSGLTTCSKQVRHCLREKGVPYQSRYVELWRYENLSPDYLKLNPNGVVPTPSRLSYDSSNVIVCASSSMVSLTCPQPVVEFEGFSWKPFNRVSKWFLRWESDART